MSNRGVNYEVIVLGGGAPGEHLCARPRGHADGLVVPGATHLLQLESAEISATLARALAEFFARDAPG